MAHVAWQCCYKYQNKCGALWFHIAYVKRIFICNLFTYIYFERENGINALERMQKYTQVSICVWKNTCEIKI